MNQFAKRVIQHPLISGSSIIIAGSMLGNLFNFLFNLFMSRNLPVEEYGILVSIVSLVMLSTIPLSAITPAIVNFAASYFAKNELGMISLFYRKVGIYLFGVSIAIILFILFFSGQIAGFFKIPSSGLVVFAGITVAIVYLGTLNAGLIQAKLSFKFISFSNLLSTVIKFSIGVGLVLLGFGINGAVIAFLLSFLVPFAISFLPIRAIFTEVSHSRYKLPIKEILQYGIPSAITIFGLNSLVSTDLLLVKHLFTPEQAGIYAGLSLVGRVIFFLTAPVGTVMYPLITQKHQRQENYKNTLFLAIGLVFVPSLFATIFYFLFPEFTLTFFIKKKEYLEVANLLGYFGLFIAIYSVISLLTYYFLSIKKTFVWLPLAFFALAQAVLITIFHQDFQQIITISLSLVVLLLVVLLLYFGKLNRA